MILTPLLWNPYFLHGVAVQGKVSLLPWSPMAFSPRIAHGGGSFIYCNCWCVFDILSHKEFIEQSEANNYKMRKG